MDTDMTVSTEEVVEQPAAEVAEAPAEESARAERRPNPRMNNNRRRKKVCIFCEDKIDHIDYKDTARLRKFISERGKILPRRVSGACAKHQRQVTVAVKRARVVALLPYISD